MRHSMSNTFGHPGDRTNSGNRGSTGSGSFQKGATIQSGSRNFDYFFGGDDFPGSGGAIGLTSKTHRKILFFTCLSVTTEMQGPLRNPFRSHFPVYRREQF